MVNVGSGERTGGPAQLQLLRRSMQCSQERLAELSGVSVRAIRKIEAGVVARPHRGTLDRLADALGLHGDEASRFVAEWHPVEARPAKTDAELVARRSRVEDFLSADARRARSRQQVVLHTREDLVADRRTVEWSTTSMVVRAAEDGLDRAVLINRNDSEPADEQFELVDLRNCEVASVVAVPDLAVRIVELDLGTTLRRGEVHRYGFTRRNPPVAGDEACRAGIGVMAAGGRLVEQQVTFAAGSVPAGLRYTWSDSAAGPEFTVEELRLSRFGSAGFTVADPVPGLHQIVWEWPD